MPTYHRPVQYYPEHYQQVVELAYEQGMFEVKYEERSDALYRKNDFNKYLKSLEHYQASTVLGMQASRLVTAVMDRKCFVVANVDKMPKQMLHEMQMLNRKAGGQGGRKK